MSQIVGGGTIGGSWRRLRIRAALMDLSKEIREALRAQVLDSIGRAIGTLDRPSVLAIRAHVSDFGGRQLCSMIGETGPRPSSPRSNNSAAVRYPDFKDSHLAKGETCHPSEGGGRAVGELSIGTVSVKVIKKT
jgi:2-methylcitrate dehydratase